MYLASGPQKNVQIAENHYTAFLEFERNYSFISRLEGLYINENFYKATHHHRLKSVSEEVEKCRYSVCQYLYV